MKQNVLTALYKKPGRTPPGVRGLKRQMGLCVRGPRGRTPPGVRGLKLVGTRRIGVMGWSHPTRGAWIETNTATTQPSNHKVAPHPGCVD